MSQEPSDTNPQKALFVDVFYHVTIRSKLTWIVKENRTFGYSQRQYRYIYIVSGYSLRSTMNGLQGWSLYVFFPTLC